MFVEMEKFNKFMIKSYTFDKKTFKAVFNFSFDEKVYFVEEIDFSCQ